MTCGICGAIGGNWQAAAELVADGHARAALLIDPDPAPLADETARERQTGRARSACRPVCG